MDDTNGIRSHRNNAGNRRHAPGIWLPVAAALALSVPAGADTGAPLRLMDAPTAGVPAVRGYVVESRLADGGSMVVRTLVGVNRFAAAGVSWGGADILGAGRVSWQPHVGFAARVRLVEESMTLPAVAVGFDTQGEGPFLRGEKMNRFRHKSRGVWLAVSRNWRFLGDLGGHGGANWSLEDDDGDSDPSFWAGFDKSLGRFAEARLEYDAATNEDGAGRFSTDRGTVNAAVFLKVGGSFTLEFDLRNLLRRDLTGPSGTVLEHPQPSRELRFVWTGGF